MLRRYFLPLLTLLAGINGVNSQAQPIRILYPDRHGLEFYSQDAINVSYETNFTEPYLYVWCSQGVASRAQSPSRPPSYNNTAKVTLDFTDYDGEQCWFEIRPLPATQDVHGLQNNSIEFNFRNLTRASGPATFGLSSTTTPSTTLPTSTSSSATTSTVGVTAGSISDPTQTSSTQTSSPASSGLSTAAVAGIGVAGGIAGIVIAAIIGVLVMRWRKKKQGRAEDLAEKTRRHYEQSPSTIAASVAHEMAAPHGEQDHKYSFVPSLRPQEMDAQQTQRFEAA